MNIWNIAKGIARYNCPTHGDQGGFVGVAVELSGLGIPDSLKSRSSRKYCMACWIDMMDREMEPLEEIRDAREREE